MMFFFFLFLRTGLDGLYNVSYLWYNVFAVFIVIIVGLIVSFATGESPPKIF